MKNKDIEKKIYDEFNAKKPELFDKILEQCPGMNQEKEKTVWEKYKHYFTFKRFSYSFASMILVVLFILFVSGQWTQTPQAYSIIAIDVNPSIVLELDEDGKVIEVLENNDDAELILKDMDLIGVDYNVAVNAIVGSMVINGYISELTNSVLLSINSSSETIENTLMSELSNAITAVLENSNINGSVITQELDLEENAEDLADVLDISEAKAELILKIIELDPRMTSEELATLSINDLNLLLESKNYSIDNISKTGTASTSGLIPTQDIFNNIVNQFSISSNDILEYEIEIEQDDGLLTYEVEIITTTHEYEFIVNAKTGDILEQEINQFDTEDEEDNEDELEIPDDVLSQEQILEIIYTQFSIVEEGVTELEVTFEEEDGFSYYVIEFIHDDEEYEIEINATSGDIITYTSEELESFDEDDDLED